MSKNTMDPVSVGLSAQQVEEAIADYVQAKLHMDVLAVRPIIRVEGFWAPQCEIAYEGFGVTARAAIEKAATR